MKKKIFTIVSLLISFVVLVAAFGLGNVDGRWGYADGVAEDSETSPTGGGAICSRWATGPAGTSVDYNNESARSQWYLNIQGVLGETDWNQIRYGGDGCSSCENFDQQSGFGFDGVNDVVDPVYPYTNQTFLLGRFCHFNNPITASACGNAAKLYFVDLQSRVAGITCPVGFTGPTPDNALDFSIRFNLDETPNVEGQCLYPSDSACSDAVTIGSLPGPDSFTCTSPENVQQTFYIQILGFVPVGTYATCPPTPSGSYSTQYISQETGIRCACLYAKVSDFVPTYVDLEYFNATGTAEGVQLTWKTTSEIDNQGFNVYRALSADGHYTKINSGLIPSQGMGSPSGAEYTFLDKSTIGGVTYFYWLEDIATEGYQTEMHGPRNSVSAAPYWKTYVPLIQGSNDQSTAAE